MLSLPCPALGIPYPKSHLCFPVSILAMIFGCLGTLTWRAAQLGMASLEVMHTLNSGCDRAKSVELVNAVTGMGWWGCSQAP